MKGFKSTSTNPYTYTQSGVWKKGQYTFQAVVLSDSGYAFAFQRFDTTWQTVDLSWQVKDGSYSKIQWTFTLEVDAVAFRLIANTVTGETIVLQPMLEKGSNGSTPIAHEEDLRGMDGDNHEFIFTRNTTGIAPETPLSTQDDDYVPEDWTDNAQGVTSEISFEFVSMRERKNGVWLDFSPPSLWAKWGEDGLSVNLLVEGHYNSHWEGTTKVVDIVGGVDVGGSEVVKVSAVFRKGEENIAATVSQSRGFQWHVNGVHLTAFDNQPFITLDETYGDGFADYVVLSYLVNSIREEERREIINISEGMDGIGEEFIFKANNSGDVPPVLPQTTDTDYQDDDYYGQGTANEWNDDPVAPTKLYQFVWAAKRKKIGGIWEAFGTPSVWTKWVEDGEPGKDAVPPIIIDGFWAFWDDTLQDYEKSSFSAIGDDGHSPYVDELTGTWFEWNGTAYEDTGITAKGDDAKSLILSASSLTMACDFTNAAKPGQTITINAKRQNVTGVASFDATPYNDNGTALTKITLGGSGNTRTLTDAQWLSTFQKVVITATLGSLSDTVTIARLPDGATGEDGEDGEDGITIIPSQQGYTYRADLNGNIIGSLANGMVELTITSGSTPITCSSSTSGGTPTTNGTYRVTRTLGNGITTSSSLSGGKYRITPASLTVDEASVELEIKIMMGGVVTSYPLTLTYRKQFDGADGKSTEFIFKGHISDTTAPTIPSTSQQDDWYGQGTANEWNDDLVEPTKSLPYVWASQRKKINGVWGAFTTPKVWLRYAEDGEPGEDGDGITSTTIHYAKSSNGTTPPSNGWSTSLPTPTMGWYLWTRTTTTYKFAETTVSYSVSHWAEDGDAIVSTTIEYAKSSSGTTIPSTWSTSLPTPTKGMYLWTRTTIEYKTSPTTVSYSISYWAEDGDDGEDGDDAKDIRLTATNTQAVIGTNGVTPTQITVTGTAKNTTIQTWWYSANGADYHGAPNGVTRAGNVVTINTAVATWRTLAIRAFNTQDDVEAVITISIVEHGDPAKTITLSANATKITVGQGNVSSPTQISVKATAVNTTVQTWEYSINGAGFTTTKPSFVTVVSTTERTISSSTLFKTITLRASRVADEASDIITISREGGAPYVDSATRTWWEWSDSSNLYVDTGMSPVGIDGAIPYPAGYYDSTKWYRREAEYAPYVQYGGALYLLIKDTPNAGIATSNTTYWKAFNNWEAVFVNSLVAAFAKIGGAVFTGDTTGTSSGIRGRLISETGVKSGADNTNYSEYVGDTGSWIPKLMLNFLTGAAYFGAKKTMFNPDGSGQLAGGNIEWDVDGNTVTEGLIRVPFVDGNYSYAPTPKKLRNYVFTNNNDLTVWTLPDDPALNGVRVTFINWRTSTKTLRLENKRFFGEWYGSDTKRFDIPANGFCEMVGFSIGTSFQGWLITNSGTIL